jgi:hypothetical protein
MEVLTEVMLRLDRGPFARDIVTLGTEALAADAAEIGAELVGLAVEIVSPSSESSDRLKKPKLYARAGIPNFLLVELSGENAPRVFAYTLGNRFYRLAAEAHAGQVIRSRVRPRRPNAVVARVRPGWLVAP